jgi:hypothetical protein
VEVFESFMGMFEATLTEKSLSIFWFELLLLIGFIFEEFFSYTTWGLESKKGSSCRTWGRSGDFSVNSKSDSFWSPKPKGKRVGPSLLFCLRLKVEEPYN